MYFVSELRTLSIEDNIITVTNIETFIIKLRNQGMMQVPNYLMSTWDIGTPPRPIYLVCD